MSGNFLGLKILVGVMGLLIVIGTAIVATTIIKRMNNGEASSTASPLHKDRLKGPLPRVFGDVSAKLPAGAVIEEMIAERRRLILRIRKADGAQAIFVFDLGDGRQLGTINLAP